MCGKGFFQNSYLTVHMITRLEEKPYKFVIHLAETAVIWLVTCELTWVRNHIRAKCAVHPFGRAVLNMGGSTWMRSRNHVKRGKSFSARYRLNRQKCRFNKIYFSFWKANGEACSHSAIYRANEEAKVVQGFVRSSDYQHLVKICSVFWIKHCGRVFI
ncbi:hypothetical protein ILYODFUR_034340 [Ilyodon furcidens]|uniref:C2H2-type domain-containing protein n=1 Tax=Ilyodon furcidens TaxID=33524 RepID=A0ABV0TDG5_9TELE